MATVTFKVHTCKKQKKCIATLFFNDQETKSSISIKSKEEGCYLISRLLANGKISEENCEQIKNEIHKSNLPNRPEKKDKMKIPVKVHSRLKEPAVPTYHIFYTEPRTPICFLEIVKEN